jgi:hypothetical protein
LLLVGTNGERIHGPGGASHNIESMKQGFGNAFDQLAAYLGKQGTNG